MLLLIIFIFLFIVYLVFIYFFLKKLYFTLNVRLKYFASPDTPASQYLPFQRTDYLKWRHWEIYFCAIFLFVPRMFFMIILTILYFLIIKLATLNHPENSELTPMRRKIIKFGGTIIARGILFCAGFYWISYKNKKIKKYLPSYEGRKKSENERAPIIVANHTSWLDIYYFISSEWCPSFLSKKEISSYPFIGTIAKGLQSVFVARDNRDDKNSVLHSIEERTKLIQEGKLYPQIIIFPEGTTTNGKYLISFKKGAFFTKSPVQVVCLKYKKRYFSVAYDVLDTYVYLLVFLQLRNDLKVMIFDVYYPSEAESNWEVYAKNVKTLMMKALKVESSESGFEEQKEYYSIVRDIINKKKE